MQQRLPRSVLRALAAVAATTFTAGVLLEQFALDFLQGHPYFVNLLSGATGFSTTALIVATLFNRAIADQTMQEREPAIIDAVHNWRVTIDTAVDLLETPMALPWLDSRENSSPFAVRCPELVAVLHMRWDGRDLQDEHTIPAELPFVDADGEPKFLAAARILAEDRIPALLRAFQAHDDPDFQDIVTRLASAVEDGRSFDAAVEIRDFVELIQKHPHHAAYLRTVGGRRSQADFWRDIRERWRRWRYRMRRDVRAARVRARPRR